MTDTVTDVESPASVVHQINANYFLSLVAFTILYHDYALTLGDEVRFVWGRKTSTVACLFFANRYVSVIGNILVILQSFANWSLTEYHQFFSITVQVIVAVIVILRTYALYELNLKVAITMGTVAFMAICFAVEENMQQWVVLGHSPTVVEPYDLSSMLGCHPLISHELAVRLSGAWGSLLLFDTVVVVLTLRKAIVIRRLENRRLFHVLIRDGTVYYFFFALINLAQIVVFLIGAPLLRGVCTTFANVISTTLISRLMLNLQNPRLFQGTGGDGRTMVSSLGAFVAPAVEHDELLSGSSTEDTWPYESTEYATWNNHAWNSLGGTRTGVNVEVHQDIELSAICSHAAQNI